MALANCDRLANPRIYSSKEENRQAQPVANKDQYPIPCKPDKASWPRHCRARLEQVDRIRLATTSHRMRLRSTDGARVRRALLDSCDILCQQTMLDTLQ